jgi:hypothetical protein
MPFMTTNRTLRARALRPAVEPLEGRPLLSTGVPIKASVTPAQAQDNQNYITNLIGTNRLLTSQEAALENQLVTQLDKGVSRYQGKSQSAIDTGEYGLW